MFGIPESLLIVTPGLLVGGGADECTRGACGPRKLAAVTFLVAKLVAARRKNIRRRHRVAAIS
jgi:hypothetical protein